MKSSTMLLIGGGAVAAVAIYYLTKGSGSSSSGGMQPSTQPSPAKGAAQAAAPTQSQPSDNTPDWMKTVGGYAQGANSLDKAAGGSGNAVTDIANLFK